MYDLDIRSALKDEIICKSIKEAPTVILDEISLNYGCARVDVIAIDKYMHGYEIKSNRDRLTRLPEQIKVYNTVFDLITLVVEDSHLDEALPIVPGWWGIKLAELDHKDNVILSDVRLPQQNPNQDKLAIIKLLSREEAFQILKEMGAIGGLRSKNREVLFQRLIELTNLCELRSIVRQKIKERKHC